MHPRQQYAYDGWIETEASNDVVNVCGSEAGLLKPLPQARIVDFAHQTQQRAPHKVRENHQTGSTPSGLPSGLYLVRAVSERGVATRTLTVTR